mmetsp:Transcript_30265/g.57030  ORF Transcript_30265/g.57030 Transcript_30265/m.57030 type:complete len:494 (+) Transcript_30265:440-1921(+)
MGGAASEDWVVAQRYAIPLKLADRCSSEILQGPVYQDFEGGFTGHPLALRHLSGRCRTLAAQPASGGLYQMSHYGGEMASGKTSSCAEGTALCMKLHSFDAAPYQKKVLACANHVSSSIVGQGCNLEDTEALIYLGTPTDKEAELRERGLQKQQPRRTVKVLAKDAGCRQHLHADGVGQHPQVALVVLGNRVMDSSKEEEEVPTAVFMIAAKGHGDPLGRECVLVPCFPGGLIFMNGALSIGSPGGGGAGQGAVHGKLPVTHSAARCTHVVLACKRFKRVVMRARPGGVVPGGVRIRGLDPARPLDYAFYRMAITGPVMKADSPFAFRRVVQAKRAVQETQCARRLGVWIPGLMLESVNYLEGLALVPNIMYGTCVHTSDGVVIAMTISKDRGEVLRMSKQSKLELWYPCLQHHHSQSRMNAIKASWDKTVQESSMVRVFYSLNHPHACRILERHSVQPSPRMKWIYAANMYVSKILHNGAAVTLRECAIQDS